MSEHEPEPEPTAVIEVGATAEVIPAAQVEAEQAANEEDE
jgi:hypothetical protein